MAETLGGTLDTLEDALFGGFPGSTPGIGQAAAAVSMGVRGRRPSMEAERAAVTFGFSRLGSFFDSLAMMGVDVQTRGPLGSIGGEKPDIADKAVQDALAGITGTRTGWGEGAPGTAVGDTFGAGVTGAEKDVGESLGQSERGGQEGRSGTGTSSPGGPSPDSRDSSESQGLAEGGTVLVTKQMLKGADPEGPDQGDIKLTVQEGEMVMVVPRELVLRYGPERFEMMNAAMIDGLKQHMNQGAMKGQMPIKRTSAL